MAYSAGVYSLIKPLDNETFPCSELMWAHYADSHKGFCIEYDLDIRLAELYTNLPILSEPSKNYTSITAHGIVYWYLEYVLNKAINDYNDALEQAELLNIFYTNKQTNYKEKQALYEAKYKEYLQIFIAFIGSEYWEYYKSSTSNKNEQMKKLIEEVKNLWYDFILTLDKGFKKEIEAGMYQ